MGRDTGPFLYKNEAQPGEVMFSTWVVTQVFDDACHWDTTTVVDAGTSPNQLITALAGQQSRSASSAPSAVAIDGFVGQQITLTVSPDMDTSTCTNGNLHYWRAPGPDSGLCCNAAGNIDTVDAVDANGKRVVVLARHYPASSAADVAELQSIVDSIQIQP